MAYDFPSGRSDLDDPGDDATFADTTAFEDDTAIEDDTAFEDDTVFADTAVDEMEIDIATVEIDTDITAGDLVRGSDDQESASVEAAAPPGAATGPETADTDDGDFDIALLDEIEKELAEVALALERLGDGSYGRCETCGEILSDEELASAPAGRFCRAHLPLDIT